jgi:hypothetical protein
MYRQTTSIDAFDPELAKAIAARCSARKTTSN